MNNAQPLVLNYLKGSLALAHNGNLVNANTGAIYLYGSPDKSAGVESYSYASLKTANKYSDMTTQNIWIEGDSTEAVYEFRKVTIEKKWDDNDDRDKYRPDEVSFNVFLDGVELSGSPYTVHADDGWTNSFVILYSESNTNEFSLEEIRPAEQP